MARTGEDDAGKLDWPIEEVRLFLPRGGYRCLNRGVHDPHRHHLRRHIPLSGAGASLVEALASRSSDGDDIRKFVEELIPSERERALGRGKQKKVYFTGF